jgi:DNA-directed RNA polymerase specialized sigma24 family protein
MIDFVVVPSLPLPRRRLMSEVGHSISVWLERLRHSDEQAARQLWLRFFDRMVAVARQRLWAAPRRAGDEEDAALSAFADFARAVEAGRFPDLHDREGLWALLFTFTLRKARAQLRHEQAPRRGGHLRRGMTYDPAEDELPPEEVVAFQDELAWLLRQLPSDEIRQVALRRLEGYGNDEIAGQMGCSRATVERRFRLIRQTWRWLIDLGEDAPIES